MTTRPTTNSAQDAGQKDTIIRLESKLSFWLGRLQCDHSSVRRALHMPATGEPVVLRIRGAYWVGTAQQDYCLQLGSNLAECQSHLNALGIA